MKLSSKSMTTILAATALRMCVADTAVDMERVTFDVKTDREPVAYGVGDTMTFTLSADFGGQTPDKAYFINWVRTGDDGKTENGKAAAADGPVVIKTSIDRPGFVRVQASLRDADGNAARKNVRVWGNAQMRDMRIEAGAGAAVREIRQAAAEPEDFDAFWAKQKARLAEVPLKFNMEKLAPKNGCEVYAVTVDCAGPRPVTGYLTIPEGAAEKSMPARVSFHGYGVPKPWMPGGNRNAIHFDVNAHGYELGKDNEYYKDYAEFIKSNGHGYAFDPAQNENPETAYFNGMALRVMRALQFVKQLPQWNGKELVSSGGSQGGLQSVWAAGLDPDVTRCENDITWCCNIAGPAVDKRLSGWMPKWVPALGYYDAINHAKRIKCPVSIPRASLGDYTCPPSSLAALYNAITTPKKIVWTQNSDHGTIYANAEKFTWEDK